jgi:putative transposase
LAARLVRQVHGVSERRGCAALGVGRSTIRYRSTKPDQAPLRLRIRDLAKTRVRYGYFRIYILLRREGWVVNHKRVYRLYREERAEPQAEASAPARQRSEAASRDSAERALVDGLCLRCAVRRPAAPGIDRGRRLHV